MPPLDAALTTACLPPSLAEAAALAALCFGVSGQAEVLSGERDANFRITAGDGQAYVLKIANPAEDRAVIEMQIAALRHLAHGDPDLPVQRVRAALDGTDVVVFTPDDAPPRLAWMVSYMPGSLLASVTSTAELRRAVGQSLARVTQGLRSFSHAAESRELLWDLGQASRLFSLVGHVADPQMRARVTGIFRRFSDDLAARFADLPQQIVHADFNAHNLIVSEDGKHISGILDFGDMVRTARVADLAVALSYHLGTKDDPWAAAQDVLDAYQAVIPLTTAEQQILPALIETRLAMTIVISEWRAALYPENKSYILRNNALARLRLAALAGREHG